MSREPTAMGSVIDEVTELCSRGIQAGARGVQTGSLLLHGSPVAAGWLLGWLVSEFGPHVLTGHALSAVPSPLQRMARGLAIQRADTVLDGALRETFGDDFGSAVHHPLETYTARRPRLAGLVSAAWDRRRYCATTSDISYGPGGRNQLDIWRRPDLPDGSRAPVLIQVPGGGWSINDKRGQAYPLMSRMVELGWICVPINYSRSPGAAWPTHITDVKRAIAWVRENIADYGGDPDFIAITGGSAGGHLSSLAALTAGDERLQPGFEDADTSVQAAAPHYGVYDLTVDGAMHALMMPLLEHLVMQSRFNSNRQMFEDASPVFRVHRNAPPFFILHGENDDVVPNAQARAFAGALRSAGARTVSYAEIPHAHHAFDTIATLRCQLAAEAVAAFLGIVYGRHVAARGRRRTAVGRSAG